MGEADHGFNGRKWSRGSLSIPFGSDGEGEPGLPREALLLAMAKHSLKAQAQALSATALLSDWGRGPILDLSYCGMGLDLRSRAIALSAYGVSGRP
jgi:hypothetical protein